MKQELNIGTLLDHGKYRVERILGQGGFGITYLVTDLGLDKLRTIKEFFPKDFCQRDETTSHISLGTFHTAALVERLKTKFIKEARNIANLDQHHGIVKIQTVCEENNTAYYVMDYIEGESLSSMVKRQGPISVDRAVRYIKQVGEALAYVHSHNINHLDVKPANIMVRRKDDKPILIDFGLAKQYDSEGHQTSTTPTGISHGFAPFEQYRDGGVMEFSPQTDIYSLAATLYYLISGKIPPNASELIESGLSFSDVFPPELQKVIRKAMSTRRQDRHETVKDFINALDSLDLTSENTILAVTAELPEEVPEVKRAAAEVETTPEYHGELPEEERTAAEVVNTPEYSNALPQKKSNKKLGWIIAAIILLIGGIAAVFIFTNGNNPSGQKRAIADRGQSEEEVFQDENSDLSASYDSLNTVAGDNSAPGNRKVVDMAYESPLGMTSYTGEVDENNLPHGRGVARWAEGDILSYDGEWVHGVMEGETVYTRRDGDVFKGKFTNNKYYEGRYTSNDGSYFQGTFKDGAPDKGSYYDLNGKEIEQ